MCVFDNAKRNSDKKNDSDRTDRPAGHMHVQQSLFDLSNIVSLCLLPSPPGFERRDTEIISDNEECNDDQ